VTTRTYASTMHGIAMLSHWSVGKRLNRLISLQLSSVQLALCSCKVH